MKLFICKCHTFVNILKPGNKYPTSKVARCYNNDKHILETVLKSALTRKIYCKSTDQSHLDTSVVKVCKLKNSSVSL